MAVRSRLGLWGAIARPYLSQLGDGPNPFSFTPQSGIALSQVGITSNEIVISGVVPGSPITIVGDTGFGYSLNGGAYQTGAGTVNDGDTLDVRVDSSGSYNTGTVATVTINDLVVSFIVTTIRDPNLAVVARAPVTRLHLHR